ncbi:hypothetical protein HIM_04739 [Hirsutella minnesotensis 3608]|uniref:Uncharacterized protein n=1 Tax=Hirsutella minnesotensis 3608 TaxID=1043627 RepID=A0A0F7ZPQ6_9HYPO|nr:hypothetical protein HIM_04739 [Hirsutella minnesotensis 3608]
MGNTTSFEAPRKPPQKLSKARPASHVFDLTDDLPVPDGFLASSCHRYCDDYLAGSRRTLSYQHLSSPSQDANSKACPAPSESPLPPPRSPYRCPVATPSTIASPHERESHIQAAAAALQMTADSVAVRRPTRANTVVYASARDRRSLTRASSLQSNVYPPSIPRVQSDMTLSARRRLSYWESVRRRESSHVSPVQRDAHQASWDDALSNSVQSPNSDSPSLVRATSRASYIPMRRQSLILTPGVATRTTTDHPPLPAMPDIQINRVASVAHSDLSLHSDDTFMSLPTSPVAHLQDRPITPCEANYRQLGGIKFGTLRITNGSPVSTPALESDERIDKFSSSSSSARSRHSLKQQAPAWPLTGNQIPPYHGATGPMAHVTEPRQELRHSSREVSDDTSFAFNEHDLPLRSYNPGPPKRHERSQDLTAAKSETLHQPGAHKLHQEFDDREIVSPEILDVRQELLTFRRADDDQAIVEQEQSNSITRSDSGGFSTSTSSRQSSQRTLSNTDSGYGSNLSSRSDSTKSRTEADQDARVVAETQPAIKGTQTSTFNVDPAHRLQERRSMPLPRTSFAVLSRDKLRRLSTRVSRFPQFSTDPTDSLSHGSPSSLGFGSVKRRSTLSVLNNRAGNTEQSKQGKLNRILGGSKRQSRAGTFTMPFEIAEPVPVVPENLKKLHGRGDEPPPASNRRMTRASVAPPLKSTPNTNSRQKMSESSVHVSAPRNGSESRASRTRHNSLPSRSIDYASKPLPSPPHHAEEPALGVASRMTITRKPVGSRTGETDPKQFPSNVQEHSAPRKPSQRGQSEAQAHGANPKSTSKDGKPVARTPSRTQQAPVKSILKIPSSPTGTQSLKPRASAPALVKSPEEPPCVPQLPAKLVRPLSFRARSAKTARDLLPSQATPIQGQGNQESLRHTGPALTSTPNEISVSRQAQLQVDNGIQGGHPPVVYRQGRQRNFRDNSGQEYRVLHSYNSPAYRNVPIWG